jgi:hypothetical protein
MRCSPIPPQRAAPESHGNGAEGGAGAPAPPPKPGRSGRPWAHLVPFPTNAFKARAHREHKTGRRRLYSPRAIPAGATNSIRHARRAAEQDRQLGGWRIWGRIDGGGRLIAKRVLGFCSQARWWWSAWSGIGNLSPVLAAGVAASPKPTVRRRLQSWQPLSPLGFNFHATNQMGTDTAVLFLQKGLN